MLSLLGFPLFPVAVRELVTFSELLIEAKSLATQSDVERLALLWAFGRTLQLSSSPVAVLASEVHRALNKHRRSSSCRTCYMDRGHYTKVVVRRIYK